MKKTMEETPPEKKMIPFIVVLCFVVLMTVILSAYRAIQQEKEAKREHDFTPQDTAVIENDEIPEPSLSENLNEVYAMLMNGRTTEAEQALRTLVLFYPDNGEVNHLLGQLLYRGGKAAEAELCFRKAILKSGSNGELLNELAFSLAAQKRYQEAEGAIRQAIALHPEYHMSAVSLVRILLRAGKLPQALEEFRNAHALLKDQVFELTADAEFEPIRKSGLWQQLQSKNPQKKPKGKTP